MKRKLWVLFGLLNLLVACTAAPQLEVSGGGGGELTDEQLHWKFRGIHGLVLVLDAAGSEKNGVTITDQRGLYVAAPSLLSPKGRRISAYPGGEKRIPRTVRATWREGYYEQKGGGGGGSAEKLLPTIRCQWPSASPMTYLTISVKMAARCA